MKINENKQKIKDSVYKNMKFSDYMCIYICILNAYSIYTCHNLGTYY